MGFHIRKWTTGQLNALVKRMDEVGGEGAAKRALAEDFELRFLEPLLLGDLLHAFSTPGAERLVVDEVFKVDKSADVPIGWLGDNFPRVFGGSVEKSVPAGPLTLRPLMRPSLDGPIIEALGGKKKVKVTLAEMHATMAHLGRPNKVVWVVGYVEDPNDPEVEWAVNANWHPGRGGWDVEADSVERQGGWSGGVLVLSRDS